MRAINHALTGAAIGLLIGEPLLAVPMAFVSHFVCDMIPHHGSQKASQKALATTVFLQTLVFDAALCGLLVVLLYVAHPVHWLLAAICAFLAASPDFFFVQRFIHARSRKAYKPGTFVKWASDIQWFQRPIGWVVELAWLMAGVAILLPFVG